MATNRDRDVHVVTLKCPQCGAGLPDMEGYVVCQYCGTGLMVTRRDVKPDRPPTETVVRGMRLELFSMGDPQGTGLECFRMLVPVGWEKRGGVIWNLQNVGMPATAVFQLWNPKGLEAFELLPNMNFTWSGAFNSWLTGGRSFGAEVCAPVDAQTAVQQFVLPRYRGDREMLRVTRLEPFPALASVVGAEAQRSMEMSLGRGKYHCDAAKARLTYSLAGHRFEEEIWTAVEIWRIPIPTMFAGEHVSWFVDYIVAFRAGEGKLDAVADLFQTLVRSLKVNPHWKAAYEHVITQLAQAQIRHIHQIGQISRQYAQWSDQMRQESMESWYGRQAVYDRLATDWSETIRGVESYYDPYKGYEVELPAQYGYAWANSRGEYIVTDDANFNPNVDTDSTLNWELLQSR